VTTISEADLDAFKVWVATYSTKDRPEGFCRKPKSIHYAVSRIKHMVEWGWSKRLLDDMPRNLKEFGRVKLPQPKPLTYANDELVALYQKAREKARGALELYILLAINCGYSQIDIASLERGMVDFTTGIITRTRHKTGVAQHSKLWPITLDLLRKYAEPTGDLLLKTRNGNPLVWHKLRDDGKISTSDCILQAFNCLRKGITTKSFTDIRNTGASRIKHQYRRETPGTKSNQELFDLYLAHSPHKMVASYDEGDFSELFVATGWLSTLYQWRSNYECSASKSAAMICPHCQTKGTVWTKPVAQKAGVSGGKATLTGGLSVLVTGLPRVENKTQSVAAFRRPSSMGSSS
jgi:integrase